MPLPTWACGLMLVPASILLLTLLILPILRLDVTVCTLPCPPPLCSLSAPVLLPTPVLLATPPSHIPVLLQEHAVSHLISAFLWSRHWAWVLIGWVSRLCACRTPLLFLLTRSAVGFRTLPARISWRCLGRINYGTYGSAQQKIWNQGGSISKVCPLTH